MMDYQFLDVRLRELEKIVEEATGKRFEPKCRHCFDTGRIRLPHIEPGCCHCQVGKKVARRERELGLDDIPY